MGKRKGEHAKVYPVEDGCDKITFPTYMYLGFKGPVDLDTSPIDVNGFLLSPGVQIVKIGTKKPGAQSALWREFTMEGEDVFEYVGRFREFFLFDFFQHGRWPLSAPDAIKDTGYHRLYFALGDFDENDFYYNTCSLTVRMVAKHFEWRTV